MKNYKIGDITIEQIINKLDYTIENVDDRIDLVKKLLYDNEYIKPEVADLFEEDDDGQMLFSVVLTKSQSLSHTHPFSKLLERMSDYILFAPSVNNHENKIVYKFYNKSAFIKRLMKDESIENISKKHPECEENIIEYLIDQGQNYKLEKKQKILKKDLVNPELLPISELEDLKEHLSEKIRVCKEEGNRKLEIYKLSNIISEIYKDQIIIKDAILKPINFKSPMEGHPLPDLMTYLNYSDVKQVKELLRMTSKGIKSLIGEISIDINNYIRRISLNKEELRILELWRYEDATQEVIAIELYGDEFEVTLDEYRYIEALKNELKTEIIKSRAKSSKNIKVVRHELLERMDLSDIMIMRKIEKCSVRYQPLIHKKLNYIASKVVKQYREDKTDWLYLNYLRGQYKQCSKCGKIKLIQNFDKEKTGIMGVRGTCKICQKSKIKMDKIT